MQVSACTTTSDRVCQCKAGHHSLRAEAEVVGIGKNCAPPNSATGQTAAGAGEHSCCPRSTYTTESLEACKARCRNTPGCDGITYWPANSQCWLRHQLDLSGTRGVGSCITGGMHSAINSYELASLRCTACASGTFTQSSGATLSVTGAGGDGSCMNGAYYSNGLSNGKLIYILVGSPTPARISYEVSPQWGAANLCGGSGCWTMECGDTGTHGAHRFYVVSNSATPPTSGWNARSSYAAGNPTLNVNMNTCAACAAGTYSGAGATGCQTCAAGKYAGSGASPCCCFCSSGASPCAAAAELGGCGGTGVCGGS